MPPAENSSPSLKSSIYGVLAFRSYTAVFPQITYSSPSFECLSSAHQLSLPLAHSLFFPSLYGRCLWNIVINMIFFPLFWKKGEPSQAHSQLWWSRALPTEEQHENIAAAAPAESLPRARCLLKGQARDWRTTAFCADAQSAGLCYALCGRSANLSFRRSAVQE